MVFIFYILAMVAVFSAVMVVTRPNAVHSAMWLVLTFFGVAGLFLLQGAEFIAAVQILVYAGGIMVLFLFVIMLVNIERVTGFVRARGRMAAALTLTFLMVVMVGTALMAAGSPAAVGIPDGGIVNLQPAVSLVPGVAPGNLEAIGMSLMTSYLLAFELVSVVLLVAVIGAIVLCRRES
ncbi:MAG: NADH-quinone oxidoreductase subunit J [Acidobacteriota bacterium]